MNQAAKLAKELRIGDVLVPDALPARIIRELVPVGEMITIHSVSVETPAKADASGTYAETVGRDQVVTIEEP